MTGAIIDREKLPALFPTHKHSPVFWEQLGRAIASFGFLEEVLGKAIFAFTATRKYSLTEIDAAYQAWLPKLERALTDQLWNLAEAYGTAARDNPEITTENIGELVEDIKKAASIRNVLCHGSWRQPNASGASVPLFVNKRKEVFETPIDVAYLEQVQMHVAELICCVIDTVTVAGWCFPGSAGPGRPLLDETKRKMAKNKKTVALKRAIDWRAATLTRIRKLIKEAAPDAVEEAKWKKPSNPKGVPTWSQDGIICTGETYKDKVKLTFAKGAALKDPSRLFNASLDVGTRRAIDIREGEKVNETAFKALIREAVELNTAKKSTNKKKPALLSGENPQIAKGYGDAPVQAYIAAIPGWKRDIGKRLDAIITRTVPGGKKAVKWNSPFYGIEEGIWFASFHCFTNYVKVTFFKGTSLKPIPAGTSKHNTVRYYDIREGEFDEKQFVSWVKQAAKLPGEKM